MITASGIHKKDNLNLVWIVNQLNDYLINVRATLAEKKERKAELKAEKERDFFVHNLFHNAATQKQFFDFIDVFIRSQAKELLDEINKEEAAELVNMLRKSMSAVNQIKDNHCLPNEFESLEDFYACSSALALVHTIQKFYVGLVNVAEIDPETITEVEKLTLRDKIAKKYENAWIELAK